MYNQGIELLISNKKNLKNQLNDESEKSNIDSGVESSSTDFNSITDLKNLNLNENHQICISLDPNNNSDMVFIKQETNTGYCVDSVEPKCNELKRLIDEFKFNYFKKLNNLKTNKTHVQKLTSAKEFYKRGIQLFNEQDLISMSQDKSRKYLMEIEEWLNEFQKLNLCIGVKSSSETCSEEDTMTLSSFDMDNQFGSSEQKNKQANLLNSYDLVCSQLKSLSQLFEKRRVQLKKMTAAIKPVQRVEPQQQHFEQHNQFINIFQNKNAKLKSFDTDNLYEVTKPKRSLSNADSVQSVGILSKNLKKNRIVQKSRKLSNDSSSSSMNENDEDELEEQKKLNEKKIK